jgi:hypothetical protein
MDKQRVIEIVVAAGGIRNEHNYIKPHIMICEDKLPEIAAQILLEAAKACESTCRGYDSAERYERGSGAARCQVELEQMAKELTE